MKKAFLTSLLLLMCHLSLSTQADVGYSGLLYSRDNHQVPKYAGAFGTGFTVNRPQAIFHPDSNKTFFTFSSNLGAKEQDGMAFQISCFDHNSKALCEEGPVTFHTRPLVDAHDNPAILIDNAGFIWLYISGRASECANHGTRCGEIYKSHQPSNIRQFLKVESGKDFTYAQPWLTRAGKVLLFTRYNDKGHREIWVRKTDGKDYLLVTGGHYFVSVAEGNTIHVGYSSLLNPGGGKQWNADLRTNLYYIFSNNGGRTWQTSGCATKRGACEKFAGTPDGIKQVGYSHIRSDQPSARFMRTLGQSKTYIQDIRLSDKGEVLMLFTQSTDHRPVRAKRVMKMSRLIDDTWHFRRVDRYRAVTTTHNYNNGFIEANGDVIAPFSSANKTLNENFSGGELVRYEYDADTRNYATYSHVHHRNYRHNNNVKDVINKTEASAKDFSFFWGDSPIYSGKDYSGKSYLYFANSELEVTQMTP